MIWRFLKWLFGIKKNMVDYKFKRLVRNPDEIFCRVSFYEGSIRTENEFTPDGVKPVTRYRRDRVLETLDFIFPILSLDQIRTLLNSQLLLKGTPIPEQT